MNKYSFNFIDHFLLGNKMLVLGSLLFRVLSRFRALVMPSAYGSSPLPWRCRLVFWGYSCNIQRFNSVPE
jgi:hypothetical protein